VRKTTKPRCSTKQPTPITEEKENEENCFEEYRKQSTFAKTGTTAVTSRDSKLVEECREDWGGQRASDEDDLNFMERLEKENEKAYTNEPPLPPLALEVERPVFVMEE